MTEKTFTTGQVICKERTYEACMYELTRGSVGVYAHYGQTDEKCLTQLKAAEGVYFGEMGLLEAMPRSATVVALEDVTVQVITDQDFGAYFTQHPDRIYGVMAQLGGRIRSLSQDYLEACRASAELVESRNGKKEKSSWFKKQLKKIVEVLNSEEVNEALMYSACGNRWFI